MGKYQWHGVLWSNTGCPGEFYNPGWWTADGKTLVVADYRNPATGKPYTPTELDKIQGVVIPPIVPPVTLPVVKPASSGSTWVVAGIGLVIVMAIVAFVMLK